MLKTAEKMAATAVEVLSGVVVVGILFNSVVGFQQIFKTRNCILAGQNLISATEILPDPVKKEKMRPFFEEYPSIKQSMEGFTGALCIVMRYMGDPGIAIGHSASARFIKGDKFTMEDALDSSVLVRSYRAWEEQKAKAAASAKLTKG